MRGGPLNIFLASSQTVPRPLSRFDTHPQVRLGTTENQDGRHEWSDALDLDDLAEK